MPIIFFREPEFFGSLEFFYGLLNSDFWVTLDHLKFNVRARQHRCRIKTSIGVQMLSATMKHPCNKPIAETLFDNYYPWKRYFLSAIKRNYDKTEFFSEYYPDLKLLVLTPNALIETFNVQSTLWILGLLKKTIKVLNSRDTCPKLSRTETIKFYCDLLKAQPFARSFKHPEYQQYYEPFEKNLSILDCLFCEGAHKTRKLLNQ